MVGERVGEGPVMNATDVLSEVRDLVGPDIFLNKFRRKIDVMAQGVEEIKLVHQGVGGQ